MTQHENKLKLTLNDAGSASLGLRKCALSALAKDSSLSVVEAVEITADFNFGERHSLRSWKFEKP